jgi:cell division protein FtsW
MGKASTMIELERRSVATRRNDRRDAGLGERDTPALKVAPPKAKRASVYVMLLAVVTALNLVGLVMVLSASAVLSIRNYGTPWHYFIHQLMWVSLGGVAFIGTLRIDYHVWRRFTIPALAVSVVGLVAVLIPGVGVEVSGASRWIGSSSLQLQPSEFAKMALVLFVAHILDRRGDHRRWAYRAAPVLLVLALLVGLVMLQPDMGTSLVLAAIALGMLFAAGLPLRGLVGLVGLGAVGALGMAVAAPYRWARLTAFLHPAQNASDAGYQSFQASVSMGSGHLFGSGLGTSIASWGYLPNQQTDFIFAVIAQETGLVGSLFVVGLFTTLALVGVRIACRAPDRFGGLVAAGVTSWLIAQAVINIGAVVGLLPVTGVPLPYVSFGGSSLVLALLGAGVLGNVARQA